MNLSFEIPNGLSPNVVSALEAVKILIERHYNTLTNPADQQAYIGAIRTWAETGMTGQTQKAAGVTTKQPGKNR